MLDDDIVPEPTTYDEDPPDAVAIDIIEPLGPEDWKKNMRKRMRRWQKKSGKKWDPDYDWRNNKKDWKMKKSWRDRKGDNEWNNKKKNRWNKYNKWNRKNNRKGRAKKWNKKRGGRGRWGG